MKYILAGALALFFALTVDGSAALAQATGKSAVTTNEVNFVFVKGKPDYMDLSGKRTFGAYVGHFSQERNLKSYVVAYRGWGQMGEYVYVPSFYWELDSVLTTRTGHTVYYQTISKYPELAERYKAIRPTRVAFRIHGELIVDGMMARQALTFKVTDNDLVYFGSRSPKNYNVPTSPGRWKYAVSRQPNVYGAFTDNDPTDETELKKIFRSLRDSIPMQSVNLTLDIEWPDAAIEKLTADFQEYEKKGQALDERAKKLRDDYVPPVPAGTSGGTGEWSQPIAPPTRLELDNDLDNTTTKEGVVTIAGKLDASEKVREAAKIVAEGYEQKFEVDSNGRFSKQVVLKAGVNNIVVVAGKKQVRQRITLDRTPSRLRATLTWNTSGSDMDLHVTNPSGQTCYYSSKNVGGMRLDVDNTKGFGPENIYVETPIKGRYKISVVSFSRGAGTTAKVYLFLDEKLHSVKEVTFSTSNRDSRTLAEVDL